MRAILLGLAGAVSTIAAAWADEKPVTVLEQGWSGATRAQFYFTPQGSQMMRADWFGALEQPGGQGRFADPGYLAGFGFLMPDMASALNPDGLPIGLVVESGADQVGLTCSACHTSDVTVKGETLRIDGGPAQLDFDAFYAALAHAVTLTLQDPARFDRFAAALGVTDAAAKTSLMQEFAVFAHGLAGDAVLRRPVVAAGFGRADALTQIINSLAVRDQEKPSNLYSVGAPTSYPPLWLTPDLEYVQWDPIAASPIGRNAGQVLGVFGRAKIGSDAGDAAFSSTIRLHDLGEIERWLGDLRPPQWDEARMGTIDRDLAAKGEALFGANCAACHNMQPYARTDPAENAFGKTFIKIGRVDVRKIGTDPSYVMGLVTRQIETNATTAPLFDGARQVDATTFFVRTVAAVVKRAMAESGVTDQDRIALSGFRYRPAADNGKPTPYRPPSVTDMKASPLAAVWATGPYLHNGSVPTVYELLSPEAERRAVFWTGGRELDLTHLGLESDEAPGRFRFDTTLAGNSNRGHVFPPAGLTPDERMAIIEYLKTQ